MYAAPSSAGFAEMERLSSLGIEDAVAEVQLPPLKLQAGGIVLIVLGLAALVGAGFLHAGGNVGPAVGLGVAGLVTGLPGVLLLLKRRSSRGRVQLHREGLAFVHGARADTLRFDELQDFRFEDKEALDNGRRIGVLRRVDARGRAGRVRFTHYAADGVDDPAAPVLDALVGRAAEATDRRRLNGEPVRGKGWTLDSEGLHPRPGAPAVALPDLRAAGIFDGRVSLWRGTEEEPFFSTPAGSANAMVLLVLARKHMPEESESDPATLGRVLFKKRQSKLVGFLVALLFVPMFLGGLAGLVFADESDWLVALSVASIGGVGTFGLLWLLVGRFQCHERGLVKKTLFGTRTLRYGEIDRFTYSAVRMYHNGAYTGTTISMVFRPEVGGAIKFSTSVHGNDADLEFLRDSISRMVAARLHERVRRGETVAWGKNARLGREGVVFNAYKLIGKGPERSVAYSADWRETMEDGALGLLAPGDAKPSLIIQASEENFFPGMLVFHALVGEAHEGAK